jgi:hypothetical protein
MCFFAIPLFRFARLSGSWTNSPPLFLPRCRSNPLDEQASNEARSAGQAEREDGQSCEPRVFFLCEINNVPVRILCVEPAGQRIGLAWPRGIILVPDVELKKPNGKRREAQERRKPAGRFAIFSFGQWELQAAPFYVLNAQMN